MVGELEQEKHEMELEGKNGVEDGGKLVAEVEREGG